MKANSISHQTLGNGDIKSRLRKLALAAMCFAGASMPVRANDKLPSSPSDAHRPLMSEEYQTLEAALAASPKVDPTNSEAADGELLILATAKTFFDKAIDAETVRFRNVALRRRSFADGTSYTILCGETNGANRLGGMTGFRPFMVGKFQGRRYDPIVAGEMTELSGNIHNFCYNADPVINGEWLLQLRTSFDARVKDAAQRH